MSNRGRNMVITLMAAALVLTSPGTGSAAEITLDEALSRARDWAFSTRRAELEEDGARLDEDFAWDSYQIMQDIRDEMEERQEEMEEVLDPNNDDEDGDNSEGNENPNTDEENDELEKLKGRMTDMEKMQEQISEVLEMLIEGQFDDEEMERSIERAEEEWQDRRLDLDHAVDDTRAARTLAEAQARRAYVDLLVTQMQLGVESERLLHLEERKERLETQIDLGMQPETAMEDLEAEERHLEAEWYDLKGQLVVARGYLNLSMGDPPTQRVEAVPFGVRTRQEMDVDEARDQFRADAQTISHLEDRIDRLEEKLENREDELDDLEDNNDNDNDDPEDEMLKAELEYEKEQFELQIEMLELEIEEIKARADVDLEEAYQAAQELERRVENTEQDYRDGRRHLERLELQEELGVVAPYELEDYELELKELETVHQQARYNYYLAVEEFFLEQQGLQTPAGNAGQ